MPTAVATNGERVFVAVTDGDAGSAVLSMKPDGRDAKQVVGTVPGTTRVVWGSVRPSPDGELLALAAQGDDGYSRTFIVSSGGGTPIALANRRDSYLHGWSAAGDRLFLIEGNTFQGETTSLVSVARNGTGRRILVPGAE
jgi:Tol biopolymer transport system component